MIPDTQYRHCRCELDGKEVVVTVAWRPAPGSPPPGGVEYHVAFAHCNPLDQFSRLGGRQRTNGRLEKLDKRSQVYLFGTLTREALYTAIAKAWKEKASTIEQRWVHQVILEAASFWMPKGDMYSDLRLRPRTGPELWEDTEARRVLGQRELKE